MERNSFKDAVRSYPIKRVPVKKMRLLIPIQIRILCRKIDDKDSKNTEITGNQRIHE